MRDSIRRNPTGAKEPLTTPADDGYRSSSERLRAEFDLSASVRPARILVP
jgi:isocitrate dehydrogenase